jgi:hypothetical protein
MSASIEIQELDVDLIVAQRERYVRRLDFWLNRQTEPRDQLSHPNQQHEKLRQAAESHLLDGENPESRGMEEPAQWSSVYGELLGFKERLRLLTLMRYKGRQGLWEQRAKFWS